MGGCLDLATWPRRAVLVTELPAKATSNSQPYWTSACMPCTRSRPGFVMSVSEQTSPIMAGTCLALGLYMILSASELHASSVEGEPLPLGEWIHIALRSDLKVLEATFLATGLLCCPIATVREAMAMEVCLDGQMVITSARSLPPVPLEVGQKGCTSFCYARPCRPTLVLALPTLTSLRPWVLSPAQNMEWPR